MTARGLIASQIAGWLRIYWGQALVDFYVEADQTAPKDLQIAGFNPAGNFVSVVGKVATAQFTKLETDPALHEPNAINLWLMKALDDGFRGEALSIGSSTAILTDIADDWESAAVAAHEIGHCLGLDDAENINIAGPINNTVAIEGLPAARKRLLMLHAGGDIAPKGGWMTISEVEITRNTVNGPTYPPRLSIEPGP